MKLRHTLASVLTVAIRRKVAAGSVDKRLMRLTFRPSIMARLGEDVEALARQKGDVEALESFDVPVDDENSLGFMEVLQWVIKHWDEVLPLLQAALLLLPLFMQREDQS